MDTSRSLDDLFKDLGILRRGRSERVNTWSPPIDVHENDHEFLIKADLPVCI